MRQPNLWISLLAAFLFACFTAGCGGSGSSSVTPPPPNPTFSSVPPTAADEGADYTYQLAATSPDGSTVTFALPSAPTGASLSAGAISWTPTHNQSRIPNEFSVTATTAKGGSATQSWTVTPSGIVNVTSVATYWTPAGQVNQSILAHADALVAQSDGALTRLEGIENADGSFSIPHVPAGYFWLQLGPAATYWTSSSTFDAGRDIIGNFPKIATQNFTTTFTFTLSGADPIQTGDAFTVSSNVESVPVGEVAGATTGATTAFGGAIINGNIDLSGITTLFFNQYHPVPSSALNALALGPSATESNVTINNVSLNSIAATLSPSPTQSIPLDILGSAWATNFQNSAPSSPTPLLTDFSVAVQPFAQNNVVANLLQSPAGVNLTLLAPAPVPPHLFGLPGEEGSSSGLCRFASGPNPENLPASPLLIDIDQNFGTVSYGDPYPSSWLREFEICQYATVQLPRPNSTATDSFLLGAGQLTTLPSGGVTPLIGPVQSPTINGMSFFQTATLDTTTLNLAWNPPMGVAPFGYYVSVYILAEPTPGSLSYFPAGKLGTAKTSTTVPFITAGNTYVFLISAQVNAGANMETSPNRAKLPLAYSTIVSSPITIAPGSSATISSAHN